MIQMPEHIIGSETMENKNIILILIIIIVILAVVAGAMFIQSGNAKQETKIKINSDKTLHSGDKLSVQLTDLNKTALSKEMVNILITNKKGKIVVNESVKTNSKGKATIDLDLKKGKYDVNVTFEGNENYTGCFNTQKLTMKKVKTTETSSKTNDYPNYNEHLGNYRNTGISEYELGVIELESGQYVVVAGDGYYEYGGLDSEGHIIMGNPI